MKSNEKWQKEFLKSLQSKSRWGPNTRMAMRSPFQEIDSQYYNIVNSEEVLLLLGIMDKKTPRELMQDLFVRQMLKRMQEK